MRSRGGEGGGEEGEGEERWRDGGEERGWGGGEEERRGGGEDHGWILENLSIHNISIDRQPVRQITGRHTEICGRK